MTDYITLGGVEYPVCLGIAALRESEKETKKTINQILESLVNSSIDETVYLCYLALKHGARKTGTPFALSLDEVADLLDENGKLTELSNLIGEQLGKIFAPVKAGDQAVQ